MCVEWNRFEKCWGIKREKVWLRLFLSQTFSHIIPQHFSNLVHSTHTYLPMKVEQTQCSETSAYKLQMPGNYPEESIQNGSNYHMFGLTCRWTKWWRFISRKMAHENFSFTGRASHIRMILGNQKRTSAVQSLLRSSWPRLTRQVTVNVVETEWSSLHSQHLGFSQWWLRKLLSSVVRHNGHSGSSVPTFFRNLLLPSSGI